MSFSPKQNPIFTYDIVDDCKVCLEYLLTNLRTLRHQLFDFLVCNAASGFLNQIHSLQNTVNYLPILTNKL